MSDNDFQIIMSILCFIGVWWVSGMVIDSINKKNK